MECKKCGKEYNERNYISCPTCYQHETRLKSAYYETVENLPINVTTLRIVASFYYRNRHRVVNYREFDSVSLSNLGCCRLRLSTTYGWVFKRHGRKGYQVVDINVPERV